MPLGKERISLQQAKEQEAQRRYKLLGNLVNQAYDYNRFTERARQTMVPIKVLKEWHQQYQKADYQGLIPIDWQPLDNQTFETVMLRYNAMATFIDDELIDSVQIAELAKNLDRSIRTAERWAKCYRIGGLWGLTAQYNPLKNTQIKQAQELPRDLGAFDEATWAEIDKRRELLGTLADHPHVTNAEVNARAAERQVSERTIWNYLRAYRTHGLAGLAPRQRCDRGKAHQISSKMTELIQAIRLTHHDWTVRAVYELACEKASQLGEVSPSIWQVRNICSNIPKPVKLLADRREDAFRNKYRITYPIPFTGIVYQIDHTPVDVLVRDQRRAKVATTSGEVRLWLTIAIEAQSRVVVAARFSYDRSDRHTVAGVIRDSLLAQPGGVPHEIWVDNGKDLVSTHVRQLTRELGITLHNCAPHQPQHRGIGERFFGTLNTRLWSRQQGYVDSNTVDRNPSVKAMLTAKELEVELRDFLNEYHQEVHSSLDMSPLTFWTNHCLAPPIDDPRKLDTLMKEATNRQVIKIGIKYDGRQYWHAELGPIVGETVLVRADTRFETPDEIEVYHNGYWLCTAFALDSERGQAVKPDEIHRAQQQQRKAIREKIEAAKVNMAATDAACGAVVGSHPPPAKISVTGDSVGTEQTKAILVVKLATNARLSDVETKTPPKDLLRRMAEKAKP